MRFCVCNDFSLLPLFFENSGAFAVLYVTQTLMMIIQSNITLLRKANDHTHCQHFYFRIANKFCTQRFETVQI